VPCLDLRAPLPPRSEIDTARIASFPGEREAVAQRPARQAGERERRLGSRCEVTFASAGKPRFPERPAARCLRNGPPQAPGDFFSSPEGRPQPPGDFFLPGGSATSSRRLFSSPEGRPQPPGNFFIFLGTYSWLAGPVGVVLPSPRRLTPRREDTCALHVRVVGAGDVLIAASRHGRRGSRARHLSSNRERWPYGGWP
jgi:hypothetical protein